MHKYDATKDYYRLLGVRRDATAEEIDRAYRNQARKRHPDGGGSEEEMKSLNEAHDILRDAEARRAYDSERHPPPEVYTSSAAFDPEAASKAGTFGIPVSDPDYAGLVMGAVACFGLGIPLLMLVEFQWMFFLWPLRIGAILALGGGLMMSHSAMLVKMRKLRRDKPEGARGMFLIRELVFWTTAVLLLGVVFWLLYFARLR
jgi:DnaJ-like protein